MSLVITIDGPAGSGKSTVAKRLARELQIPYIDTGAMYRCVAYKMMLAGFDWDEEARMLDLAGSLEFRFALENGEFVTFCSELGQPEIRMGPEIRTPEISMASSKIAQNAELRKILVAKQQAIGSKQGGILEGRDAGTVIFPKALIKFFVTASAEERARRRHEELCERLGAGAPAYEKVLEEVNLRDRQDSEREASPLRPAEDAELVDTSQLDEEKVFQTLLGRIRTRIPSSFV